MEATHEHAHEHEHEHEHDHDHEHAHAHEHEHTHAHEHEHEHGHDHHGEPVVARGDRPREDWFDEDFVGRWIGQQEGRAAERRRQFVLVRSLVPKTPDQEFRYINLGAGPGNLDEVLLEQFKGAQATLVDGSMAMLAEARKRLERFEDRVEFVQGNLSSPQWTGAVQGPFDVAVSTIALHNLRDAGRIRELYEEIFHLLGHGGIFLNLDYVRPTRDTLRPLAAWAGRDPEAGLSGRFGGRGAPGTLEEQVGWLREAGYTAADCFWKEFQVALFGGLRDHLHLPEIHDGHEAHAHDHHDHDHHEHEAHGHDDHDHEAHAHEAHGHEAHAHEAH
jgi:tRNA (cmo5U34)-methyltransferase